MPMYTYLCQNKECNHQFDVEQKITDGPIIQCEICGERVEKIITQTSFVLNGGGWFSTGGY